MPSPKKRREDRLKLVPTHADHGVLGKDGKCGMPTRKGTPCKQAAGNQTSHPGFGACNIHGGEAPSLKRHAAKQEIRCMAQELEMEPDECIRWAVRMTAGMVFWLQNQIECLDDSDPATLVILPDLIKAYGDERDRLAKTARLAIDAGIAEREMALMEQEAEAIAGAIQSILQGLNLNAEQRAIAPALARKALLALPAAGQTA